MVWVHKLAQLGVSVHEGHMGHSLHEGWARDGVHGAAGCRCTGCGGAPGHTRCGVLWVRCMGNRGVWGAWGAFTRCDVCVCVCVVWY